MQIEVNVIDCDSDKIIDSKSLDVKDLDDDYIHKVWNIEFVFNNGIKFSILMQGPYEESYDNWIKCIEGKNNMYCNGIYFSLEEGMYVFKNSGGVDNLFHVLVPRDLLYDKLMEKIKLVKDKGYLFA